MSRRTFALVVSLAVNVAVTVGLHDRGRVLAFACGVAAGLLCYLWQLWLIRGLR